MQGILGALALFAVILLLLELGRRIGAKRRAADASAAQAGIGAVNGAVFSLLGLLVAFTFSGAATRFDTRRELVIEEANDVGTAWLRITALPTDAQPSMRDLFRRYVDSRLETYRLLPDLTASMAEYANTQSIQGEIWALANQLAKQPTTANHANMLLLPAMNAMFDIAAKRAAMSQMHPPLAIWVMLGILVLVGALLVGDGMAGAASRSLLHMVAFAAAMALSVWVILDLEYPRLGIIRVDAIDQLLLDLRQSMR